MIELIFVIVVLGIVASIGSSAIARVYKQYIIQQATERASMKTELAAMQIANMLSYRILGTTLARDPDNLSDYLLVSEGTYGADDIHTLLEWIGEDHDGFISTLPPGWDGFCDVNTSTQAQFVTPGSRLSLADTIMNNLSEGEVSLSGPQYPAIFFKSGQYTYDITGTAAVNYDVKTCMGVTSNDRSCISSVSRNGDETLVFQHGSSVPNKLIAEHYKLAWSAYAICPKPNANGLYDLVLYYNYQPWENERLSGNTRCEYNVGKQATIVTNVSVFKFAEIANTFRFKICVQEDIGEDHNLSICKEKAVTL